jgi:hypothetical protein
MEGARQQKRQQKGKKGGRKGGRTEEMKEMEEGK